MLDLRFIRENPELIRDSAEKKGCAIDMDALLQLDSKARDSQGDLEGLRHQLKQGNQVLRTLSPEEKPAHLERMKEISTKVKSLEVETRSLQDQLQTQLLKVPSPLHPSVPVGRDDSENVEVSTWGEVPDASAHPLSHVELGKNLDLMDIERGVKLSGSRFYFLKNEGTLLELAVLRYALDFLVKRGFTPMTVPVLVKDRAMMGTGYFPGGEDQAYTMEKDELHLVGTSEVPLASYYCDEILAHETLPIRMAAWSNCFRREAGTYGKDTQGLYRIHQFQKVEQVYVMEADEDQSLQALDYLLKNSVDFLKSLEIPHQVVDVCSGDLGQGQVKKYDINSWMPSRGAYCETHSCSMFYDFQARRLKLRYKTKEGKKRFCFTLNNTLIASPRILIPLLELNQTQDGGVRIPSVLVPYMQGIEEIRPK